MKLVILLIILLIVIIVLVVITSKIAPKINKTQINLKKTNYMNTLQILHSKLNKSLDLNIPDIPKMVVIEDIKEGLSINPETIPVTIPIVNTKLELTKDDQIGVLDNMFELYYKGVPDTYDKKNNKIAGIEPDANKSISVLQELIDLTNDPMYYFKLANIYQNGMHNFLPNDTLATNIYNYLLNRRDISKDLEISSFENLKTIFKSNKTFNKPNEIPQTGTLQHNNIFGNENMLNRINEVNTMWNDANIYEIIDENDLLNIQDRIELLENNGVIVNNVKKREKKEYDDPQNTHNTGVVSTTLVSLDKLIGEVPKELTSKDKDKLVNKFKDWIKMRPTSDRKKDSLKSLEHILSTNSNMNGRSEVDALISVLYKLENGVEDNGGVNGGVNETGNETGNGDNRYEILYHELSDMVEHDHVVCPTGRVTRIVNSLNGLFDVKVMPMYAIREEMMGKAALLRKGYEDRNEYDDESFKKLLKDSLYKDYVDTKILSSDKFDLETSWIEYL